MTNENSGDNKNSPSDEAVDVWGRPLSELPDWQLLEDARSIVSDAFATANGLIYCDVTEERRAELKKEVITHIETKKKIPTMGRDGWIDTLKRYPKICSDLKREFDAHEPLGDR